VAALQGYPEQHIWIYSFRSGAGYRLTSSAGSEGNPVWSPDGRAAYYVSAFENGARIIRHPVEQGSVPEIVFQGSADHLLSVQDVTPEGRYLIVIQVGADGQKLFHLDVTAPDARKLEPIFTALPPITGQFTSRVSPDGRSIVVTMAAPCMRHVFRPPAIPSSRSPPSARSHGHSSAVTAGPSISSRARRCIRIR
jgi:tricorn protease-like protein